MWKIGEGKLERENIAEIIGWDGVSAISEHQLSSNLVRNVQKASLRAEDLIVSNGNKIYILAGLRIREV